MVRDGVARKCYDDSPFQLLENALRTPGRFITFEGLDGCGKSTQLALAAEHLRSLGYSVTATREPGGTPVGQQIRDVVVNASPGSVSPLAELALMFAARAQHIEQVILPALQRGQVLCDRFVDSTVAYQGFGHGISLETIRALDGLLCQGMRPDLTLLLDVDAQTSLRRTAARNREARQQESRFEKEGMEFFERVRKGYLEIARQEPGRVKIIDGSGSIVEVQEAVRWIIEEFLGKEKRESAHGV
jgi:dTMP kinase